MRFIKNSLHNKALLKFIMTLVLFLGLLSFGRIEELSLPAYRTLCCSIFMVLLWIFECFPLAVTSLLPIFLFPLLEISSAADTTKPYAHPVIFLFLGGFFLAISIKTSGLDKRIASLIIRKTKGNPKAIMAGFILFMLPPFAKKDFIKKLESSDIKYIEPRYEDAGVQILNG